ncbi:uncharacterized protein G2W53_034257 [Senna tora]|uniref:Uncharacterized protein n=1 Tax=Senna tora TaxID=362788 RepID=A0A834T103_9FABA|nr:uncharacterized protein G2W53_034257 [Senna tora]
MTRIKLMKNKNNKSICPQQPLPLPLDELLVVVVQKMEEEALMGFQTVPFWAAAPPQ